MFTTMKSPAVLVLTLSVWPAVAPGESLETIEVKLAEQHAKYKTLQLTTRFSTSMPASEDTTLLLEGEATSELARRDDTWMSRSVVKFRRVREEAEHKKADQFTAQIVSDGRVTHFLVDAGGQTFAAMSTLEFFQPFQGMILLDGTTLSRLRDERLASKLLSDEQIEAKACHVIERTLKGTQEIPMLLRTVTAFRKDDGLAVRAQAFDEDGQETLSCGVVKASIHADPNMDAYVFKPPAGCEIRDFDRDIAFSGQSQGLPPEYATTAGEAFRDAASSLLEIKAMQLKQEGDYRGLYRVVAAICRLQPKSQPAWSYQAWNFSYNLSAAAQSPDRWQWIYHGIRLLRDEGIPCSGGGVLYDQLAWTWFHKVGDRMDDHHWEFKRTWASMMETLLGPPPGGLADAKTIDWFRPIALAPRTLDVLTRERPGTIALVRSLGELGINLNASTSSGRMQHALEETFFRPYTVWLQNKHMTALRSRQVPAAPGERSLPALFASSAGQDFDSLLAFLRAKVLREQYKMEPQFMLEMTACLGSPAPLPIDWRTPWAQSMYWALHGLRKAAESKELKEPETVNNERVLLFSLIEIAKAGRYVFRIDVEEPMDSFLEVLPDPRYIEAMHLKYIEFDRKHANEDDEATDSFRGALRGGHANNLHTAIVALYLSGKEREARRYLDYLVLNFKDLVTGQVPEDCLQSVERFMEYSFKELMTSPSEARSLVYWVISNGYMAMAAGWPDEYAAAIQQAELIHGMYLKNTASGSRDRPGLPPFPQLRAGVLADFLLASECPLPIRVMIWKREELSIKQDCYDTVIASLKEECNREDIDVAKAFPSPEVRRTTNEAQP